VDDPAWYDFARTAAREYPALIADLADQGEADVSYCRVGALLLAGTPAQPDQTDALEQARRRLAARSAGAPEMGEVSLLDGGQARELFPQRGQIVHIGLDGTDTSRWPVVLPSATGHYLLAFDGSRVVAGATREAGSGYDVRVTPGGLAEVLSNALSVAPGLSQGTLLETRVGLRPVGPDIRPLLGPVRGVDGLVVATGLGPTGLTMGPLAGAVAARVALGLPPGVDLRPFDPLRS